MKIAIFHELDFGGARRAVEGFVKGLNDICDVDLYYVDDKKDESLEAFVNKIFFYPFYSKVWKEKNWRIRLYKDTIELTKLFRLHKKIASDINSKKYDVVFIHPSKFTQSPFLLRFLKGEVIYYCQEPLRIVYDPLLSDISHIKFPERIYEFLFRKVRKFLDKKNLENVKIILANSIFSKNLIKKVYGKPATVCYLGVDINLFKPLNLKKSIDVLFIGNRSVVDPLIDQLSIFSRNKLKIYAIFRGESVRNISDAELVKIYNKSKLLVVMNRNEPFGLIPLEAMACGIPVIALDEGGYRETVIDHITGFLIPNSNLLYEKINKIINNEKLRIIMSKKARENVFQNWTWKKSVENLIKIVDNAVI